VVLYSNNATTVLCRVVTNEGYCCDLLTSKCKNVENSRCSFMCLSLLSKNHKIFRGFFTIGKCLLSQSVIFCPHRENNLPVGIMLVSVLIPKPKIKTLFLSLILILTVNVIL